MNPGENEENPKITSDALNVGAVAVLNADAPADSSQPAASRPASKIGAFAIAKADEKMMEPGEHLVTVVRRHPIGILGIYAEMLAGIAGVIVLVLLAIYSFFISISTSAKGMIVVGAVFVIAFLAGLLVISTVVYRRCRLVVTDKSVVQVIQKAMFNRKISRLSMSNVEDVNVEQKGILQTVLNYGTLTIQTAGEVDNFVFPLCPNPDMYANRILEARQQFVRVFGEHPIEPPKN